ncbi:hypothetical protein ACE41H_15585 [Paenibacillus enshidis]|uniref:Uncharacterized protein n=1 Tax=Paenibacillus enshidis TaxID=1458439 RepID=A0ABV5AWC5_9BACL
MLIKELSFKWHVQRPAKEVIPVLLQIGLVRKGKHLIWTKNIDRHTLEVEHRQRMDTPDCSYFWIRWYDSDGDTTPEMLERILSEWFFTIRMHFATLCVNWFQAKIQMDPVRKPRGFRESSPSIWLKIDESHVLSLFPVAGGLYYFEVRQRDINNPIHHHRYLRWMSELKYSIAGKIIPDDQMSLDMMQL